MEEIKSGAKVVDAAKVAVEELHEAVAARRIEIEKDKVIGTVNIIVYENIPPSVKFTGEVYGRYIKVVIAQLPKALHQYMLAMAAKTEGKPLTDAQKATMGK